MNDWDPRENPLVQRAFRVGFRPGPTGFKTGWWLAGLGISTIGPFFIQTLSEQWTLRDTARWMFFGLLIVTGLIFVIGGFQRMLVSFTRERERGTFEFLHLSTLRSSAIVLGFLMAGQLPGYLVLVFVLPVLALCALMIGFPLTTLGALVGGMVFYVLVLSVFFLFFGHWSKKSAELRGAALVYTVLYAFIGWLVTRGLTEGLYFPPETLETVLGFPVIHQLYSHGMEVATASTLSTPLPIVAPIDPSFFGFVLPQWLLGVLVLGVPTGVTFLALSRALRHQDRNPWAEPHAIAVFCWAFFCLLGIWSQTPIEFAHRVIVTAVVGWLGLRRFTERNTAGRTRTIQALGRSDANFRRFLVNPDEGPPLRLGLILFGIWLVAHVALALVQMLEGSNLPEFGSGDGVPGGFLLWGLAPLLFAFPLLFLTLLQQWFAWRVPSWRGLVPWVSLLVMWGPFIVFTAGESLASLPFIPLELVQAYGVLSPLSQLQGLLAGEAGGSFGGTWVLFGQVPAVLFSLFLATLIRGTARDLTARSQRMLSPVPEAPIPELDGPEPT